jgi:hypothetical protein
MSKAAMPPRGNRVYPWERWERGRVVRVVRGVDFTDEITAESFRKTVRKHAYRKGLQVTTRVKGNVVTFQFLQEAK